MINVTRLLCDKEFYGDTLRYHKTSHLQKQGTSSGNGPVVVWNITRACNLNCKHCYSDSGIASAGNEIPTREALEVIDDLAAFNVPVILFSGGEPLMRSDFFDLLYRARKRGIRVTVSTNGTLITRGVAADLKKAGVSYVGISLDGIGENNDRFRGRKGAFTAALSGIRYLMEQQQKVGLRFTINKHNFRDIADIFRLVVDENIPRVCFYHLVYSGRGSTMIKEDITHQQTREVMNLIMDTTIRLNHGRQDKEILTVDNHADGAYIYLSLKRKDPQKAERIINLLRQNGGNRSGIAIAQLDWQGDVHPDQFTQNHTVGNVTQSSFASIWGDNVHPLLAKLRNRKPELKGRCSRCRWLDICNGNFRARAEAVYGDFWAPDPACYLSDEEIGIA